MKPFMDLRTIARCLPGTLLVFGCLALPAPAAGQAHPVGTTVSVMGGSLRPDVAFDSVHNVYLAVTTGFPPGGRTIYGRFLDANG